MTVERDSARLENLLQETCVHAVLDLLIGPYNCAQDLGRPAWDFALSAADLNETGITENQLQELIAAGLVERQTSSARSRRGSFQRSRAAKGSREPDGWFVLTSAGAEWVRQHAAGPSDEGSARKPLWLGRVFSYGGQVLKVFKRHAPLQERILDEFQQADWAASIPSPLGGSVKRLRDALNHLNNGQQPQRIRFDTTRDGLGVRWSVAVEGE